MSISIVIVTYNSSEKISKLLRSIDIQNNVGNIEIIIVDNNSPDLKSLRKKIDDFKVSNKLLSIRTKYQKSNDGFGASCNYGGSLSTYPNILFINPDTQLFENALFTLLVHLRKNGADICGGKCIHADSDEIHRTVFRLPNIRTMLFEYTNLGKLFKQSGTFYLNQNIICEDIAVDGVGGAYMLFRKSSFNKICGFDSNIFMYLEDVDICNRAKEAGMKVIYCPHSIIQHVGGASSNNKYRIAHEAWFDSREYYAKKHFPLMVSVVLIILYKIEKTLLLMRLRLKTS